MRAKFVLKYIKGDTWKTPVWHDSFQEDC